MPVTRGFIVHAWSCFGTQGGEIRLAGRLETGESFAAIKTIGDTFFFIRASDIRTAETARLRFSATASKPVRIEEPEKPSFAMDGEKLLKVVVPDGESVMRNFNAALRAEGVRTYEADISAAERFFMDTGLKSSVGISGQWIPGKRVSRFYQEPDLFPASWEGSLSVLSLDIETLTDEQEVIAISLCGSGLAGAVSEVLMLAESAESVPSAAEPISHEYACGALSGAEPFESAADAGSTGSGTVMQMFASEKELLSSFVKRIRAIDPDIILGWNITDFDLKVLANRCRRNGVSFLIGRTDSTPFLRGADRSAASRRWIVEGRQVLDGMWLSRMALRGLDDYRLETVAQEVLGRGKKISIVPGENQIQAITRLYRTDKAALASYCLEDARLVLDIMDKSLLLDITIQKSLHIGLSLDRTWLSVAGFEFLYTGGLHRRGFRAPTKGVDEEPVSGAPGGGIIEPKPGLYHHVLAFDFKSLYPSIMRTFNIDPLARKQAKGKRKEECIEVPNGVRFFCEPGILPEILDEFTVLREKAKKEGNETASYAYKIIMNSFYGVLGTDSCRFASRDLAGSVTTTGRMILHWTKDRFTEAGYEVLYGDTDSLFVLTGLDDSVSNSEYERLGIDLCSKMNELLRGFAKERYGVESKMELEFEKHYSRFFLPHMRGKDEEEKGRAKGYAGLAASGDLEITGMEAIRRDWTPLARNLQRAMLSLLFRDRPVSEIDSLIRKTVQDVLKGRKDDELWYVKSIRKSVEAYTRNTPPHIKAARMLPPELRNRMVRYVWTEDGPQPEGMITAKIDYRHYVEKQVRPIVEGFLSVCDLDLGALGADTAGTGQLELFG